MGAVSQADKRLNELSGALTGSSKDAVVMDIAKAKELFDKYGADFVSELESIATIIRKANLKQPLPNGNFLHALCLTRVMLRLTESEFLMVTGGAGGGFIESLASDFRAMLDRLKAKRGRARILVVNDGDIDDGALAALEDEYPDCFEVAYAGSTSPIPHYIVADGDMLRDEREHEPLTDDSDADKVVADVYFRNPAMASVFAERFKRQWHAATAAANK